MSAGHNLALCEAGTCDSQSDVSENVDTDEYVLTATVKTVEKKKRKSKYDHLLNEQRQSKDRRRALSALYERQRKERRSRISSRFADDPEVKACKSPKERRALLNKLYKKHGPAGKVDKPVVHPIQHGEMRADDHVAVKEEVKEKPMQGR